MNFRPLVESLEARDVPALSFMLPNGTIGAGPFSTPDSVDPSQPSQVLPLTLPQLSLFPTPARRRVGAVAPTALPRQQTSRGSRAVV
jgi:hypothetical protein